jgi:hypothetical protein
MVVVLEEWITKCCSIAGGNGHSMAVPVNEAGQKHGHGLFTYSSGATYTGQWHEDMRHGHGTYTLDTGSTYVGQFRRDKFHGQGMYKWVSGASYDGSWSNDNFNGHGKLEWVSLCITCIQRCDAYFSILLFFCLNDEPACPHSLGAHFISMHAFGSVFQ